MELQKVNNPSYTLKLTAEEITKLWNVVMNAHHAGIKGSHYFYDYLEDKRPAGGYGEER